MTQTQKMSFTHAHDDTEVWLLKSEEIANRDYISAFSGDYLH